MRKPLWAAVAVAALVVSGAAAWRLFAVSDLARIGAGYAAQQTCACLFISHRAPESCHKDLEPMAQWFIRVKVGDAQVSTNSFGVAHATSRYQPGFGCSLVE
ncbi:MAG TPA: hypothetical protein VFH73_24325 [Polyangia bacterium]|jgi:hypothetical protein|nr:hypothetical protein [Polyangia bacterium]